MKKKIYAVTASVMIALMFLFTGCSGKGIEGTWVLTEERYADGTKLKGKELDEIVAETYVIENGEVKYSCEIRDSALNMDKPIEITFTLVDLGNNNYKFMLTDSYAFVENVEVNGNTMKYTVGEGESRSTMIFKRQ